MTCYNPVQLKFRKYKPYSVRLKEELTVPCGRCIGCLLRRGRDWTVRCSHEAAMHDDTMFVTLTYNDEHLPMAYEVPHITSLPTLFLPHLQQFLKRYRKHLHKYFKKKISYFACGEYGKKGARPHYHLIVFGHLFDDLLPLGNRNGNDLFTSPTLTKLWGHGDIVIGSVTPESIAYTARYCIDKLHAKTFDPEYLATGRTPEFVTMSRNPSVGSRFFRKYYSQFLHDDLVSVSPKFKSSLPRYYDKLYSRYFSYLDSSDFIFSGDSILDVDTRSLSHSPEVIKAKRILRAALRFDDSSPLRLESRAAVAKSRLSQAPSRVF